MGRARIIETVLIGGVLIIGESIAFGNTYVSDFNSLGNTTTTDVVTLWL
jgi:hypothetical protein